MALLSLLAVRQRRARREVAEETASLTREAEHESHSAENCERRKTRCRNCKHDPETRAVADFIANAFSVVTRTANVDAGLGNGLESGAWTWICSSEKLLLISMLAFRLVNCLLIQTSYVPDEYWQSVEVAHKSAFGYGYLTWEWKEKIRSFVYPAVFAFAYKVIKVLGIDSSLLVVLLPRLMQSMLAAIGDLYLYRLSQRLSGSHAVAQCALLCQLLSWYTFYTCTRTLANSTEAVLTTVALYYYPLTVKEAKDKGAWKFLWIAALSCLIRPTGAIIWAPLFVSHIWACRSDRKWSVFVLYSLTAIFFILLCLRIDKSFYGEWIFTPYRFLEFNVLNRLSSFYGVHPWHWYFTQGLPAMLGPHIVIFVVSLPSGKHKHLQTLVLYVMLVYSLLPHKEFRFISAILPLVMHLCGYWITARHQSNLRELAVQCPRGAASQPGQRGPAEPASSSHLSPTGGSQDDRSVPGTRPARRQPFLTTTRIFVALAITNVPLMAYFSLLHQRGSLDVMTHLRSENERLSNGSMSVLFLMPCHSTPFYSHLHANVSLRFLTCEPPLSHKQLYHLEHVDEADEFYKQPAKWLKNNALATSGHPVPTHLVIYDVLETAVHAFITKGKYVMTARLFHTHFPSGRVGREVLVFHRNASVRTPPQSVDQQPATVVLQPPLSSKH